MNGMCAYYALPHPPLLIPEIGRGEEAAIRETTEAMEQVSDEIAAIKPDTIIIITPHGPMFQDAVALSSDNEIRGSMIRFRAPQVRFRTDIDLALTKRIISLAEENGINTVEISGKSAERYGVPFELDHGAMVPLYFINRKFTDYKLVHITYGLLPKTQLYKFGKYIRRAVEETGKRAVFIASGDLSHRLTKDGPYDYNPSGEIFDRDIRMFLENGDAVGVFAMDPKLVEEAGECALRSYYVLLGTLDGYKFRGETLSYQGNFGVGYLIMRLIPEKDSSGKEGETLNKEDLLEQINSNASREFLKRMKDKNPFVRLAGESLMHYIIHGEYIKIPSYATREMREQRRGVFVSLKKYGELRGCIGTIQPVTSNLAEEIIRNAVEAGIRDPRFMPLTMDELNELDISVDVLAPPEKADRSQLDPKNYGVIVRSGYRTGLLLPNLEGVNTVEEQLRIALHKAGISPDSPYTIERFQVIRYTGDKDD